MATNPINMRSINTPPAATPFSRGGLATSMALGTLGEAPKTAQWDQNAASLADYLFKPLGPFQYGSDEAHKMMQLYGMPNEDIGRYMASISSPLANDQTRRINFANFAEATLTAVSVTIDQVVNRLYQQIFDSGWALKLLPLNTDPNLANINTFTWQVYEFMDATPLVQPHGSLSRTFGMKMRARSATKQRYGRMIAIDLESLLTPKGYEKIRESITWLVACTDMLIARLIIAALMECNLYALPFRINNHQAFIDDVQRKMAQCYVVNKSEAPMRSIELKFDEEMQFRITDTPDSIVMTSNTYRKVTNVPEQLKYSNTGIPVNYDNRQVSGASVRSIPPAVMSTKAVYAYHNAMQRDSQELETYNVYGTHNMLGLNPEMENVKPCHGMFDIYKYCFSDGDYRLIKYKEALENCGLFDKDGKVQPLISSGAPPDSNTWYPEYKKLDPWTDDQDRPIRYTGQLRLKDDAALRTIARQFCSAYSAHTSKPIDAVHLAFTNWWERVQSGLNTPVDQLEKDLQTLAADAGVIAFKAGAVSYSGLVELDKAGDADAKLFLPMFRSFIDFLDDAWNPLLIKPDMAPLEVGDKSKYAAAYHHLFLQEGVKTEPLCYLASSAEANLKTPVKAAQQYIKNLPELFADEKIVLSTLNNEESVVVRLGLRYFVLGAKYLESAVDGEEREKLVKHLRTLIDYCNQKNKGPTPMEVITNYVVPMHQVLLELKAGDNQKFWDEFISAVDGKPFYNPLNLQTTGFNPTKILPFAIPASKVRALLGKVKNVNIAIQDPGIPEIFIPFGASEEIDNSAKALFYAAVNKFDTDSGIPRSTLAPGGSSPSTTTDPFIEKLKPLLDDAFDAFSTYIASKDNDVNVLSTYLTSDKWKSFGAALDAPFAEKPGIWKASPQNEAAMKDPGSSIGKAATAIIEFENATGTKNINAGIAFKNFIYARDLVSGSGEPGLVKEFDEWYFSKSASSSSSGAPMTKKSRATVSNSPTMSPLDRLAHAVNMSKEFVGSTASRIQPNFGDKVPYSIKSEAVAETKKVLSAYGYLARDDQYVKNVRGSSISGSRAEIVAYLALLSAPYTKDMIINSVERAIAPPLNIMVAQPAIVDVCEAVIGLKAGKETGVTRVDKIDNRQGISVETKEWRMHFTLWIGSMVGHRERVDVMRFADFKKHICGAGCDWGTAPIHFRTPDINNVSNRKSLLGIPVSPGEWPNDDIEDISGFFEYPESVNIDERKAHALFSSGWRRMAAMGLSRTSGFNTLTTRGACRRMDPLTGKFSVMEYDAGPWGKLANEDLRRNLSLYAPQRK